MKKIVMITECLASGVLQIIQDLCNHFVDKGMNVHLIYSRRPETPSPEKLEQLFDQRILFYEIQGNREIDIRKDMSMFLEYRKLLKQIKPDFIHLHSSKAGVLGRLAALFVGKGTVYYTPHGYSFLRNDVGAIKKGIYRSIETFMNLMPGETIAVSPSEAEYAKKVALFRKVHLVENGINTDSLNISERTSSASKLIASIKGQNQERVIIGTCGRLSQQKNPKFTMEVVKQLAKSASKKVAFVWIGGGELEQELQEWIRNEQLEDTIYMTGWMDRSDVLSTINELDYYVQFSLWEGLPVSLLEAMYFKKAPIATNVPGIRDIIQNGKNGILVNGQDEAVEILRYYIGENSEYQKLGMMSHQSVIERYSSFGMLEKYERLYGIH